MSTRWTPVALALLGGACSEAEAPAPEMPVPPESPVPGEPREEVPDRPQRPDWGWDVDLSEEAVEDMTLEELWSIGVEHLGWPAQAPASASKDEVYQRLLDARYKDAWDVDVGYTDR